MPAPLIDKRTPADLLAWTERLVACPRAVPGPGLVGAVLARDVVDPTAPVGDDPVVFARAGTAVDEDVAKAVAALPWLRLADVLVGGTLGRDIDSPASRRVHPAGTVVDDDLAGELAELARIAGPLVLDGIALGADIADPAHGHHFPAGTVVHPGLAEVIDLLTWVRIKAWQPPAGDSPDGPDALGALVQIAARFAGLVVDRVNRSPEKHELAFLNLTGAQPLPPRPARVPLTFALAPSSPVEAVVPAGTQVTASPLEGEEDDVVFETARDLVLTRAGLDQVLVSDTESDTWSDRFDRATGQVDQPFAAFEGDRPTPHQLFVAFDPLLAQDGPKDVTLVMASPDTWQWTNWPISWSYWDGTTWRATPAETTVAGGAWQVKLPHLPPVARTVVDHRAANWLRAQLDMPLPPGKTGLAPDSVAVGTRVPQDLELPLAPFGESTPARFLYLSADEAIGNGPAVVRLRVGLSRRGAGRGVRLLWTYRVGGEWLPLGQSTATATRDGATTVDFDDATLAFTQDGDITFHAPAKWPRELHRNRMGRWLRAEVAGTAYTTLPRVAALEAGSSWELPRITAITARLSKGPDARPTTAAAYNTTALDLSKDFHPFGEEPGFNDTLYLALPEDLTAGAPLKVKVQLTNPPGSKAPVPPPVFTAGNPQVVWEMSNGRTWQAVTVQDGTRAFTASGDVTVTLPAAVVATEVNGTEGRWLRARLVGGHYGAAAGYTTAVRKGNVITTTKDGATVVTKEDDTTYVVPVPATFAPPVVKALTFEPVGAPQPSAPASYVITYNGFRYDHVVDVADRADVGGVTPFATNPDPVPALYLGFDQPLSPRPTTLHLQVEPPRPEEVAAEQLAELDPGTLAQLSWEYLSSQGWQPLVVVDDTRSLARPDVVGFVGPADLPPRTQLGRTSRWLRLRWQRGYFPLPPRLRRILPNTTWADQVTTVRDEILGSGNTQPGQAFTTAQNPVQPGQQVTVREPEAPAAGEWAALAREEGRDAVTVTRDAADQPDEVWVRWHHVPDFYLSGPRDRHYTLDPLTGEVRFGDDRYGMVPPPGQNNVRITYRSGGGEQGNRAAATIVQLKSGVPYVDGVTNPEDASGGAPREPIERLRARGPQALRHRDRAVTAQDLEDLAYAASTAVARVAAVVPSFDSSVLWLGPGAAPGTHHVEADAGRMGVVVVPDSAAARPTPSLGLVNDVREHLQARGPATADLWVAGPEWVRVTVRTTVVAESLEAADEIGARARTALDRFLHPLTGGPAGGGWAFGRKPHRSDLYALLEAVEGVDHVVTLTVEHAPETADAALETALRHHLVAPLVEVGRQAPPRKVQRWLKRALVYSGTHEITVALTP